MHTYMDYDGLKFITEKILKKYIHPMKYHHRDSSNETKKYSSYLDGYLGVIRNLYIV